MKNFIIKQDFRSIATEQDIKILSSSNDKIIEQCNAIAISEAAGYLSVKYNIEDLFRDTNEYSSAVTYGLDDRIYLNISTNSSSTEYVHYTCIASGATSGTSLTDTNYFEEKDSRDQKLLEVVMSMSLFYVHKRLSPNNIPTFRVLSYDGNGDEKIMSAIKWLTMIQQGNLFPYGWKLLSENVEEIDPEVPIEYDKLGNDPSLGMMWGNDMGEEYHWYDQKYDKNIIRK